MTELGPEPRRLRQRLTVHLAARREWHRVEREEVGEVQGKRLLHLQCHFGLDTLSWARRGAQVTGIDSSQKMLDRLASNDPHRTVRAVLGDMVDQLPQERFDVVVAAYNTLFNLLEPARQQACFDAVAARVAPGGAFVVEAFVPQPHTGSQVSVRSLDADRVVLSASVHRAGISLRGRMVPEYEVAEDDWPDFVIEDV